MASRRCPVCSDVLEETPAGGLRCRTCGQQRHAWLAVTAEGDVVGAGRAPSGEHRELVWHRFTAASLMPIGRRGARGSAAAAMVRWRGGLST